MTRRFGRHAAGQVMDDFDLLEMTRPERIGCSCTTSLDRYTGPSRALTSFLPILLQPKRAPHSRFRSGLELDCTRDRRVPDAVGAGVKVTTVFRKGTQRV